MADLSHILLNTKTAGETLHLSGKQIPSANIYENSGLQFFKINPLVQPGTCTFKELRSVMTFLTTFGFTWTTGETFHLSGKQNSFG